MNNADTLKVHCIRDLLQWGTEILSKHGIDTPRLDAEVLLAHAMQQDRIQLYLAFENTPDKKLRSNFEKLIKKRSAHMPVSYITGHREFMSLDFVVDESILIPRPETEILVETVCKNGKSGQLVLELGTGSGCIAVSLAKLNPDWRIIATDISMQALRIAQENAVAHCVNNRILFIQGDLLEIFAHGKKFDWVVSNPPYIPEDELAKLPTDVREHEPMLALDGGSDGLDFVRRIVEEACMVLKPGGGLAVEIGYGQGAEVQDIVKKTGIYRNCTIIKDYSGITRVLYCRM